MKKIFTLLSLAFVTAAFSQSFSIYKTNPSGTANTATMTHGYSQLETTSANNQLQTNFKIVNNAAVGHTLSVTRSFVFENPLFDLSEASYPWTKFCFGYTCFPASVNSPGSSDYTILGPAGTNTTTCCNGTNNTCCAATFDNSNENGTPFKMYLQETSSIGKYAVRYLVYDVNNPADSSSFTVRYNDGLSVPNLFVGINNIAATFESVSEIAPNPSNGNASISVNLKQDNDIKVQVYNGIGALVYNGPSQKYPAGKHKISLDCNTYSSGLYFVTLTAGETKVTKRLIVNK